MSLSLREDNFDVAGTPVLRVVATDVEDRENGTALTLRIVSVAPSSAALTFNASEGLFYVTEETTWRNYGINYQVHARIIQFCYCFRFAIPCLGAFVI